MSRSTKVLTPFPNAPTRYSDETVEALNDVLRQLGKRQEAGFTVDHDVAAEIVRETRRKHQVAKTRDKAPAAGQDLHWTEDT